MLGDQLRAGEGALEGGIALRVAHQEGGGPVREAIHGASGLHPGADCIRAAEVLHGREESWLDYSQDGCQLLAAKNFTRSPARKRQGGSLSGRNSFTEVRPIRC